MSAQGVVRHGASPGVNTSGAMGIGLLFLPGDSPNPNRIERLWDFTKRRRVSGKYHANVPRMFPP